MTRKAGIVGWPVAHSLSPVLHGYWLKKYGIDGAFERVPAEPGQFEAVIADLRAQGFSGVNVTVPHKEAAFALAKNKSHAAISAGAANLLLFPAEGIEADNTDTVGLVRSLAPEVSISGKTVVLLGAGGAARGAILALNQLGAATIYLLNRTIDRAQALAQIPNQTSKIRPGSLSEWKDVAGDAALLVNSTSAGMGSIPPLDIDLSILPKGAVVCDIVYVPLQTKLLKDAAARGLKTMDGLGMLMHQAAPSFKAFFGIEPQVDAGLRARLESELRARG